MHVCQIFVIGWCNKYMGDVDRMEQYQQLQD